MLPVYGNYNPGAVVAITEPMLLPVLANFSVSPEILFDGKPLNFIKYVNGNGIYWPEFGINYMDALHRRLMALKIRKRYRYFVCISKPWSFLK